MEPTPFSLLDRRALLLSAAVLPLSACAQGPSMPSPGPGLKASVTYLNLLAKVPMFRGMTTEQLQWVIDHSREWAAEPGAEIASSSRGADSFWTLLDGGWQLEHRGRRLPPAGHADAGKWYGGRDMLALGMGETRLIATARSYVMEISQAELDAMLRRGIPFGPHLQAGLDHYRALLR